MRCVQAMAPAVAAATVTLLIVRGIAPAPAHAVDLFPIDDWIGDGLKSVGKIVLGPLKLTAEGIAHLLGAIVAALADLLIPKSLIDAGLGAVKWLVELPPLGTPTTSEIVSAPMPHLRELRDTLTWIGLTLLPLQIVLAGGRAFLSPTADGDSPAEVLQRTIAAAVALIAFDWLWGALTELVRLITTTLLSLPWVADGVRRMLQSLVIGGAGGTAVAAEFVIPLLLAVAGGVLLALMLLRIGLEVIASIVYATGGLALGLSVSGAGHRLLQAWLVAAAAIFALPVLWCIVFVTGAALMVDIGSEDGRGFGGFVGQLYNVGAALVTFGLAIKLARATLGQAGSAITGLVATARLAGTGGHGRGTSPAMATAGGRATPQSLARFSQQLRGGMRGSAIGVARVGAFPVRHPIQAAAHASHPVRATQAAAEHVQASTREGAKESVDRASRRVSDTDGGSGHVRRESPHRHQGGTGSPAPSARSAAVASPPPPPARPESTGPAPERSTAPKSRAATGSTAPMSAGSRPPARPAPSQGPAAADTPPPPRVAVARPGPVQPTRDAAAARAWRTTRRVVAPQRRKSSSESNDRKRKKS